jgi:hypothetical protein
MDIRIKALLGAALIYAIAVVPALAFPVLFRK